MVGIINLDHARVIQIVGIDDATIIFVMFLVQQRIDLTDKGCNVLAIRAGQRAIFAYGVRYQPALGSTFDQNALSCFHDNKL